MSKYGMTKEEAIKYLDSLPADVLKEELIALLDDNMVLADKEPEDLLYIEADLPVFIAEAIWEDLSYSG